MLTTTITPLHQQTPSKQVSPGFKSNPRRTRNPKTALAAMDEDDKDEILSSSAPSHFYCPLTLQVMENPVRNKKTGHHFEKGIILEWLFVHGNATCPLTRKALHPSDLEDDEVLQVEIAQWKEMEEMEMRLAGILSPESSWGCY
ncbi:U-box domain-containing protein [Seminavis robusta]|uniref:U-box domain-containing protein n=1 Tax=Seminavis robusta TaxID=568900 RepID=A0A9N8EGQ0_9STRA|nr:U-box domain-containing protein [Seminavis robusta]|eukprot:Sro920_g220230.1 U-box domain-containing protein (144) ;mRNA; f:18318-18749